MIFDTLRWWEPEELKMKSALSIVGVVALLLGCSSKPVVIVQPQPTITTTPVTRTVTCPHCHQEFVLTTQ